MKIENQSGKKVVRRNVTRFEKDYIGRYYIYNMAIYQIIQAKRLGYSGAEVTFLKPNGKTTQKCMVLDYFKKRTAYRKYEDALKTVLSDSLVDEVPLRRKEYLEELKEQYKALKKG